MRPAGGGRMSVTEKTVKAISHFIFANEPSEILDRLQSAGIDVVSLPRFPATQCLSTAATRQL